MSANGNPCEYCLTLQEECIEDGSQAICDHWEVSDTTPISPSTLVDEPVCFQRSSSVITSNTYKCDQCRAEEDALFETGDGSQVICGHPEPTATWNKTATTTLAFMQHRYLR